MPTARRKPPTPAIEPGVFIDQADRPTDVALETALGSQFPLWVALEAALTEAFPAVDAEWTFGGRRYGWSKRLKQRGRPIAYLTPLASGFRASLALPERAIEAALRANLSDVVRSVVAEAPSYPEGRAVRLIVSSEEDVASIVELARIRMAS